MRREAASTARAAALATVLILLAGCERGPGRVVGRTVRSEDGTGYGPVLVSLFEIDRLEILDETWTDDEGFFSFERVRPGTYVPVVHDNEREVFHLPEASYPVRRGRTVEIVLRLIRGHPLFDYGLRLQGRVTDATNGRPIEGAIVETTHPDEGNVSLFSEVWGRSHHLNRITDAEGRFQLWPLAVIVIDDEQRVPHVRIAHPGYRSAFRGGWRSHQVPQNLEVALERGTDPGVITGTLQTLRGKPVEGLAVAVEWRRGENAYPKAPDAGHTFDGGVQPNLMLPGLVGVSDADGRFRIEGIPVGGLVLDPSYPRDDGWVGQQGVVVEVTEALPEVDAGTIFVAPALTPLHPLDGDVVGPEFEFRWDPVEGATFYRLNFWRAVDGAALNVGVDSLAYRPPPGVFLSGDYVWELLAFLSLNPSIEMTRTERPLEFRVEGDDADVTPPAGILWR